MIKRVVLHDVFPVGEAVLNTDTMVAALDWTVDTPDGKSNRVTVESIHGGEVLVMGRALLPEEREWKRYAMKDIRYIGMASLLARICRHLPDGHEDRDSIMAALADFQAEFPGRFDIKNNGAGIWFEPVRKDQ